MSENPTPDPMPLSNVAMTTTSAINSVVSDDPQSESAKSGRVEGDDEATPQSRPDGSLVGKKAGKEDSLKTEAIVDAPSEYGDGKLVDDAQSDDVMEESDIAQTTGQTTDSSPDQAAGEESDGAASSGEANRETSPGSPEISKSAGEAEAETRSAVTPAAKASSKASRPIPPPFVDDPSKITLKFVFANRDGLSVTADCKPDDTVGEVKGVLLSMWPDDLPDCSGGDRLRLICMGRGILSPDSQTLEDCQVPVFKTHATPVNVSVRPENLPGATESNRKQASPGGGRGSGPSGGGGGGGSGTVASTTCACVIL